MCNILKLPKLIENKAKIGVKAVYKAKYAKNDHFGQDVLIGYGTKNYFS